MSWCLKGSGERAHSILCRTVVAFALFAFTSLLASAARAEPTSIWFRASQGCPDGQSFLERVERRGVVARLAGAGDRIDFVVTLELKEGRSLGQLERQTQNGTVAIRKAEDAECDRVAEILALTVALTVEPQAESRVSEARGAIPPEENVAPEAAAAPAASVPPPSAKAAKTAAEHPPAPPVRDDIRGGHVFGVEGSAWNLSPGSWLLAFGVAAELRARRGSALPTSSARVVARGGAQVDSDAPASLWLAALRLEGCPFAIGDAAVELRPCVAMDLGAIGASAEGVGDVAFWSALASHLRLGVAAAAALRIEAQAGILVPLTRYEVTAGMPPETLQETKAVGLAVGLGATLQIP
jgi:hypothetical protein